MYFNLTVKLTGKRSFVALALFFGVAAAFSDAHAQPTTDSLTVEAVVQQVLGTHPAIGAARKEVDAASARAGQARSARWPRVEAVGTYRRQDPVPEITVPGGLADPGGAGGARQRTIGIQPNNLYDGRLQVRQTLYDFGTTDARINQATAGRTAAQRRVEVERTDLAFQAVQAFYTTLLSEARLRVQRAQIDQLERTLQVVRRRREAGTATEFEIQSTKTRLSSARSQHTRLQSQRERQRAELRRLLGTGSDTTLALKGTLQFRSGDPLQPETDTLTEQVFRQHPSVQALRAQVRTAHRQVRVADHTDAPRLALSAQGGVKNGYPGELNEPRLNESIGLSLHVPLFEGFAAKRRVEEAEAEVQAAEARLANVRQQVRTRVEQAAAQLRASLDRLDTTERRVEQARTAAQLARTRYEAGTVTNLELIEAETELRRARLERTEVQYEVVMGRYALQRAAGTLLPFEPPR